MGVGRREIVEDSNSETDVEEEKMDELQRQLSEVPLGELQKARANGSHTYYKKATCDKILRRANKNRPTEMSSKLPVRRFREVVQAPKKVCRDPRFESLCGELDQEGFRKRYNFLFEVELPAEKKKLQMMLKKSKDAKVVEELENHISWIDKQLKSRPSTSKSADAQILKEHKKKEREAVKQGKKPFYLKKSDIRKGRLIEKYNELKTSGKLEPFIDKRRKKNASKDRRYMPYRRSDGNERQQ